MDWNDYDAALFDLDGVLTPTAEVHMRAWDVMFNAYLDGRADGQPPYTDEDYFAWVDGKPRYDGVRSFLASRGIALPDGTVEDAPELETVCGLGNRKNAAFSAVLRDEGVTPFPASVAMIEQYWTRLGLDPAALSTVMAQGDSMMPTIADHAPVFLDTGDRDLADGGIYAMRAEGRLIIRRVQRLVGGGLQLLADNASAYPPQEIGEKAVADLEILGRVRSAAVAC